MKKLFNFIFCLFFIINLSIENSVSEEKIKIGLLLPLSGQSSELGKSILRSVNLAINTINDPIVEIYPRNNFNSPEKNFLAAKKLYEDGVRIFIGPIFEKNLGNLDKLDDAVFLTLSNKINNKKSNIIFSGVNAYSQMDAINKFLKREKIKKTICLIPESNFKNEIEKSIEKTNINLKKVYYYDTKPTEITKRIEKITKYSVRKQNVLDEIKRLEKSEDPNRDKKIEKLEKIDTLGNLNFDSVIISDFDETLKSVTTSLIYTDVSPKDVYFITLNQWFDESLLNEFGSQNLYFPSVNKGNYEKFSQTFYENYNLYPSQISFLSYDLVGLVYYLAKTNKSVLINKIFDKQTVFKGKTGIFEIENKNIKHVLNFYKIVDNKFIEIF